MRNSDNAVTLFLFTNIIVRKIKRKNLNETRNKKYRRV